MSSVFAESPDSPGNVFLLIMTKSQTALFLVSLILLAIGGYYYWLRVHAPTPLYVGPAEKIIIGNIGEYSIFNLIAKENGYFVENGLSAEIVEYPSGPPAVADLLAGKMDIVIAAEFVGARNILTNKDLRILASVDRHEDFQMIVRKDAKITGPADLKGKKIGVTQKGAGEFFLGRFLNYNGIDAEEAVVFDMTPEEMTRAVKDGTIDACVIFSAHTFKIQKDMGDRADVWPIQRSRRIFATAYTTGTFIKDHPSAPERYLRSLSQAERYLAEHPEESKTILKRAMGYTDEYIAYIWPHFDFGIGLGQELLLALEDDARFIMKNRSVGDAPMPNFLDYLYFDALASIKPDAVTIVR